MNNSSSSQQEQYKADIDPPPPPPVLKEDQSATSKPKMFDPRQPQPDRLPKAKIPVSKTSQQHKDNKQFREQMGGFGRSGLSSSSANTTVTRKKHAGDARTGSASRRVRTEIGPEAGVKRKANEQSSRRLEKPKTSGFAECLEITEKRSAADDGLKAGPKAPSTRSKQKADEQSGEAIEGSKVQTPSGSPELPDINHTSEDTAAKVKVDIKSVSPSTKRKAEGEQGGVMKRSKPNSSSNATTVDSRANVATTSTTEPKTKSSCNAHAIAKQVDGPKRYEKASNPNSPVKAAQEQSLAASEMLGCPKTNGNDICVETFVPENPAVVGSGAASAQDRSTAAAPSDSTKSPVKATPPDNTTWAASQKRKRDDEGESPAKKPKLQSSNPQNSLHNYRQACFINASLHVLDSIPAIAAFCDESSDATEADDLLSEAELILAIAGGKTRQKEDARGKLRDHLKLKAEGGEL
jgi:hypothetical protein